MIDLNKVKARAKEGLHYSKWLFVWDLIAEVERLQTENNKLKEKPTCDSELGPCSCGSWHVEGS